MAAGRPRGASDDPRAAREQSRHNRHSRRRGWRCACVQRARRVCALAGMDCARLEAAPGTPIIVPVRRRTCDRVGAGRGLGAGDCRWRDCPSTIGDGCSAERHRARDWVGQHGRLDAGRHRCGGRGQRPVARGSRGCAT